VTGEPLSLGRRRNEANELKIKGCLILSTSPLAQPARKPLGAVSISHKRPLYRGRRRRHTGKERDYETGLYYYGARYLDGKTSRWISGDPAIGDYVPGPGQGPNKLSGMGGVYNTVNFHVYHYSNNNPVKYTDSDGREIEWVQGKNVKDEQMAAIKAETDSLMNSGTMAGDRYKELYDNKDVKVTINVNLTGDSDCDAENWDNATNGMGSNSTVNINVNDTRNYENESVARDTGATLAHEVSGHAYDNYKGLSPYHAKNGTWPGRFKSEQTATAMENEYRSFKGLNQRTKYGGNWYMPIYTKAQNMWYAYSATFVDGKFYNRDEKPPKIWRP
jgi:RHS repeat-associated protein